MAERLLEQLELSHAKTHLMTLLNHGRSEEAERQASELRPTQWGREGARKTDPALCTDLRTAVQGEPAESIPAGQAQPTPHI